MRAAPYALSLLRIMAGFLLMQFGSAKWFAFPASIMPGGGTAPLGSMASVAGMLEVVGGALLVLGLFTRGPQVRGHGASTAFGPPALLRQKPRVHLDKGGKR